MKKLLTLCCRHLYILWCWAVVRGWRRLTGVRRGSRLRRGPTGLERLETERDGKGGSRLLLSRRSAAGRFQLAVDSGDWVERKGLSTIQASSWRADSQPRLVATGRGGNGCSRLPIASMMEDRQSAEVGSDCVSCIDDGSRPRSATTDQVERVVVGCASNRLVAVCTDGLRGLAGSGRVVVGCGLH